MAIIDMRIVDQADEKRARGVLFCMGQRWDNALIRLMPYSLLPQTINREALERTERREAGPRFLRDTNKQLPIWRYIQISRKQALNAYEWSDIEVVMHDGTTANLQNMSKEEAKKVLEQTILRPMQPDGQAGPKMAFLDGIVAQMTDFEENVTDKEVLDQDGKYYCHGEEAESAGLVTRKAVEAAGESSGSGHGAAVDSRSSSVKSVPSGSSSGTSNDQETTIV